MADIEDALEEKLKKHIHWEEGMDESMLSFYLASARKYVKNATDGEDEHLVLLVAGISYEYRIPEENMAKAFDAMTPLFVQEAIMNAGKEESDEQS